MKNIYKFLFLLFIFPLQINAQDSLPQYNKAIYSFVPQYLIKQGIRIDIEKQIKGQHFLQVCPVFYLSEQNNDDFLFDNNAYTKLIGGGVHLYHKYFVSENFDKNPLYISYGLNYNYYEVDFYDEYLDETVLANSSIQKMGFDVIIGYQSIIKDVVSIDIFTGLGTRYALMNSSTDNTDKFNQGYLGYNYTGNLLLLGFRIGMKL